MASVCGAIPTEVPVKPEDRLVSGTMHGTQGAVCWELSKYWRFLMANSVSMEPIKILLTVFDIESGTLNISLDKIKEKKD